VRVTTRRRDRGRASPILDLTPMVDVVFLLIIFFMVSTTFITLENGLPVDLPQASSAAAQPEGLPTVTLDADERIFLGGEALDEAQLVPALQALLAERNAGTVILRADQRVAHGTTVRIMDAIRRAGATRVAIAAGG
jgi:biopolymer transport protein ExbD